jgi:hypothetical protein
VSGCEGEISEEAFLAALIKLAKRGPEGGLMWAMVQQLTPPQVQSSARIETKLSLSDARARLEQLGVPMPQIEGDFEVVDVADSGDSEPRTN